MAVATGGNLLLYLHVAQRILQQSANFTAFERMLGRKNTELAVPAANIRLCTGAIFRRLDALTMRVGFTCFGNLAVTMNVSLS